MAALMRWMVEILLYFIKLNKNHLLLFASCVVFHLLFLIHRRLLSNSSMFATKQKTTRDDLKLTLSVGNDYIIVRPEIEEKKTQLKWHNGIK